MSCAPRKACGQRSTGCLDSLAAIVGEYTTTRRPSAKLAFYANQPTVERALEVVASWKGPDGKVNAHQRRVSRAAKAGAGERIQAMNLAGVRDFEDLLLRVEKAIGSIGGIGDLATYDVALHLGAFLRVLPDRVYLQAGAREGARALGLDTSQRSLPMDVFPNELRRLEPWQVEDVLCIYEPMLRRLHRAKLRAA